MVVQTGTRLVTCMTSDPWMLNFMVITTAMAADIPTLLSAVLSRAISWS